MLPDATYAFRAFGRGDLPMMAEWLATPEAICWWGGATGPLGALAADTENPATARQIARHDAPPLAPSQGRPAAAGDAPHRPGILAADTLIGGPAMTGSGHGAAFLRGYAEQAVASGVVTKVVGPEPGNERAVRAYRRAGFADIGIFPCEDGSPALVMEFRPASGASAAAQV